MGLLDRITNVFRKSDPDECASGYPDWKPSESWKPVFDETGATPEEYDGN